MSKSETKETFYRWGESRDFTRYPALCRIRSQSGLLASDSAMGRERKDKNVVKWYIDDGKISLFTYFTALTGTLAVPAEVQGCPVRRLDSWMFKEQEALEAVILPEGLESLGTGAFANCTNLTEVTLPSTLQSIGAYAFFRCVSLKAIQLPEGLRVIDRHAFDNCACLVRVQLPQSLQEIGERAFAGCKKLTEITIPPDVAAIKKGAFLRCYSLKRVLISSSWSNWWAVRKLIKAGLRKDQLSYY